MSVVLKSQAATPQAQHEPRAAGHDTGDDALIARILDGEEAAAAQFVTQFGPRMLATARRITGDHAAAEDCVQEAFINAFKALERFERNAALSTWLHRITVNTALMRLRKVNRNQETALDDVEPVLDAYGFRVEPALDKAPDVESLMQRDDVRQIVREKIDELAPNDRNILLLRDIEELDTKEVAATLGITENAVKVRLHRARGRLKTLLEPLWRDLS